MLKIPMLGLDDICRFWQYVNRRSEDECWLWTGGYIGNTRKAEDGRQSPCFTISGKNFVAGRVMWLITYNEDPGDLFVLHECDNRDCVNPNHLWLGTLAENSQDCFAKGRGQKRNRTKLSDWDVQFIRKAREEKTHTLDELAARFNIHISTVMRIANYTTFKDI